MFKRPYNGSKKFSKNIYRSNLNELFKVMNINVNKYPEKS